MTFTILVMILVIVWAAKTIIKELDLGDVMKERTKAKIRERVNEED